MSTQPRPRIGEVLRVPLSTGPSTSGGLTPFRGCRLKSMQERNRALRMGDWKLVSKRPHTNDYALYHLARDRCEQVNLADKETNRVSAMAQRWQQLEEEFRQLERANSRSATRANGNQE